MPGEAEDIWHRAMPVYRHIHGHTYDISNQTGAGNTGILDAAASAHLAHFSRDMLLVKSPFSSFRIPQLEQHWGTKTRYIRIVRDQHETADSMRRNHFEFASGNRPLSAEDAWALFTAPSKPAPPTTARSRSATPIYSTIRRPYSAISTDSSRKPGQPSLP